MQLFKNKVRIRKRILFQNAMMHRIVSVLHRRGAGGPLTFIAALQFILLYFGGVVVNGAVINSFSGGASSPVSWSTRSSGLSVSNLGAFLVIYSALPHFANAKSIRNGKEVEEEVVMPNTTLTSVAPPLLNQTQELVNSTQEGNSSSSIIFSSRTLLNSEENTTLTPSEEMEMNLDYSSEELRQKRRQQRKGMNRLKRQMGMAAEIALIAPALQTMGCIPKFFCGMNTKPPTKESSAINDLAYLIKFAMLDDDDVDVDDPLFADKKQNNRGKDGLTRIKEDLILENMAEEELIKEDPGNLPFVWKDMEHRIKVKTKPGSNLRIDDLMDEIIVEPEQSAVGSIFSGIKSVLRIGRSVDHVLSRVEGQGNESSQATPRSGRSERVVGRLGSAADTAQMFRRRRLRLKNRPFWATPQFRQDMELAERIGKTEQDEQKCSTTFSVCPYTVHEMMEIVHGGYSKKRKQMKKKKNKPQWFLNSDGPPPESSEEDDKDSKIKPVKDPENLITTTTEKTKWYPNDPENQIYYAMFPHKAVEHGISTVPTTRRPVKQKHDRPEVVYDIGPRPPLREHRKPAMNIQGHVEYENDDDGSLEKKKPEHLDVMLHNKNPHFKKQPPPPQKSSWFSFGKGNPRPQRPPHQQHHQPNGPIPGGRPPHGGMGGPQQGPNFNRPTGFDGGISKEEDESNKSGNDDIDESSEESGKRKKRKKKKGGSASDSVEDEDNNGGSSEEKSSADERPMMPVTLPPTPPPPPPTPPVQLPPELQGSDPNIQILGIELIENGGDLVPTGLPQQPQSLQPLQPFIYEEQKPKGPISLPRPKYKIVKERRKKKKRRLAPAAPSPGVFGAPSHQQQAQQQIQTQPPKKVKKTKKEKKSKETSDEEEDEESQENSSEEKNKDEQYNPEQATPAPSALPPRGGPTVNVILHGRPSEELQGVPQQHTQSGPYPGGSANGQNSASAEDDLDSDEENTNSNSAAVEATSKEISQEMAKIPKPARPPPPHMLRTNTSNEYLYSDENDGHPPGMMRPIKYSYFNNKRPHNQHHNGGPPPTQHNSPPPPPPSTTQKYSTGFLSFLFGKDKKQQNHPPPGSMENRPHYQQHQQQQPPSNYEEDPADDDDRDDDDDDDSSEERNTRQEKPTFTTPEGKYEVGHLGNKPPPKFVKPNFSPPRKPERPYRGSTSMEDSDEKRGRTTPRPPPTTQQTTTAGPPKPVVYFGNPFQTIIPPPATPPQKTPSPSPTQLATTKQTTKDSDEDEAESEEDKPSEESKEDEEDNSSEEVEKKASKTKATVTSQKKKAQIDAIPLPPIANYPSGSSSKDVTPAPPPPAKLSSGNKSSSKKRADKEDSSNEKQADDSKQDDSGEENKESKENDEEDSDEDASSEEKKKKTSPPPPKRRPEDDELEHPSAKFPPQPPVAGDIDAVEEILGVQETENTDDRPELYGLAEDIPAPPPLALQGFAPSLEIVVPTKAPLPLRVPPGYPLQQFYQGNNPLTGGGVAAPPAGPPAGPGAPLAPGPQNPQLAPVNPTSLLGLAQQANAPNQNPGPGQGGAPSNQGGGSDQFQGLRNPLGQTSNRGPGQNNRRPTGQQNQQGQRGQQNQNNRRRPQQGNRNKEDGEDSSEEKSSEEKEGGESSEEKEEKEGGFDEAIESLGHTTDDDDDKPEKDLNKGPPPPPPVFTGSKEQKEELQKRKPFFPRPVTPQPPLYLRPNPGRREPILKHQLRPTELLQVEHPQRIRPPPIKPSPAEPSQPSPLVLPMRPSAAANLGPFKGQLRPASSLSHSFSVSHLLRPLMPRPVVKRKPLDPKVVKWIRDTYGIPDGIDPNRSGLQSQDSIGSKASITTTKAPKRSSMEKEDKPKRTKDKLKASSKRKTSVEKSKVRGSAEKRHSGEVTGTPSTSTTSTSTTTTATTTSTTTTTLASTTKSTRAPYSSLPPPTITSTASSTTTTTESKAPSSTTSSGPKRKLPPDYITEEQEAKMAQQLFSSEEEPSVEEKDSDENDDEEATTNKYKSKVKTKVGGTKLVITIKSVVKKNDTSTLGERTKAKSGEKMDKSPGKFGFSSAERKKLFLPISRDKLKSTSKESSGEKGKKKSGSKSSEISRRKSGSVEALKKKGATSMEIRDRLKLSSSMESKTKLSTTTLNPKFILRLRSTPRPKPIKLPPIYGKRKKLRRNR